ncbi:MAG: DUF354 domain-containing protein [Desulfobacterales bacterium]|nr:DUF354 domain-containing protein [Desulfobacterales bacterium]
MNIFFNISHPAHVHFFKNAISILERNGHKIIVASRKKEFTINLLNSYNIKHEVLTDYGIGFLGLLKELFQQQIKIARIIKKQPIDLMLQIGGIFNAPIGKVYKIPTLAFSDTENVTWGNKISFGLSSHVFCPTCFDTEFGGKWKNQILYPGYHELAYLAPEYVKKTFNRENNFLVRFVGWGASHDIGEKGLTRAQKIEIVQILSSFGKVHISSEGQLPDEIINFSSKVPIESIHEFMTTCRMIVGESATMASEAACLGIPAIFISNTGRGYTTEEDNKYRLIKHYHINQWKDILKTIREWASNDLFDEWQKKRWNMLKEKIYVTNWLVDLIENYPQSVIEAKKGNFERYYIKCAE